MTSLSLSHQAGHWALQDVMRKHLQASFFCVNNLEPTKEHERKKRLMLLWVKRELNGVSNSQSIDISNRWKFRKVGYINLQIAIFVQTTVEKRKTVNMRWYKIKKGSKTLYLKKAPFLYFCTLAFILDDSFLFLSEPTSLLIIRVSFSKPILCEGWLALL